MEYSSETLNVEKDPRFLFDISLRLNIDSNQDDIDARFSIAKEAIKKGAVENIQAKKEQFVENNIALSEFGWIDSNDYVARYFIWYLMLLTVQDQSVTFFNITSFLNAGFSFDIAFGTGKQTENKPTIPVFIDQGKTIEKQTIVHLHYILKEKCLTVWNQQETMDLIKNHILEFKRSNFYKLTHKENRNRAKWTIARLESDGVTLPQKIPHSEKYRSLSLAISLYLWNRASFFEPSIFSGCELSISKSEYVHKLNLSWNQFKHRENNKRKEVKAYNFEMKEALQQKIDYLSKKLDMKKNKLIEHLITKEYKEQHQKEKD
jgi:hypothetical protein